MSDAGWWQRKLGLGTAPPVQTQQPVAVPSYPQKAVRWQPAYPPTGPRQEVTEAQPEGATDDTYTRVRHQGFDHKAPASVGRHGRCPGCNGTNYFRRKGPLGIEAAPLCLDCGHNGDLFEQSGTSLNAIGMKSSGPMQFARSDNAGGNSNFGADPGLADTEFTWANVR